LSSKPLVLVAAALVVSCSATQTPVPVVPAYDSRSATRSVKPAQPTPIKYVVIIIQENRSVDNLFQFLAGADTQSFGFNSENQRVLLQPVPLADCYDLYHRHDNGGWLTEYNNGAMNGFNLVTVDAAKTCNPPPVQATAAYAYIPQAQVQPYYTLAESYAFADHYFQGNEGPSFPAHQYLVSGTSAISNGSPWLVMDNPGHRLGGCDSPAGTIVPLIQSITGAENESAFPCFIRTSIFDELNAAGLTWRYYQNTPGAGLWNAVDALQQIWDTPQMTTNVIYPSAQFLTDVSNGHLADVTYITPPGASSDHPSDNNGTGPSWVASVVNAIGESRYWKNTAIFVTWDDWGGWYDHVPPTIYNKYEDGFRVPLIAVSPYAKRGYITHQRYEVGSVLKYIEENFGLPSMGTTDERAADLTGDVFNYAQKPAPFKPIKAPKNQAYFIEHAQDNPGPPDND
jgi:phospholipase C